MLSTKALGGGTFLFLIGVLMVGAHLFQFTTNPMVFGGGVIIAIIGLFLMASGFLTLAGSEIFKKGGIRVGDQNAFSLALLRCMVAISIADDFLDDDEVAEISKIYTHLTNNSIDDEVIRDTAAYMQENDTSIETEMLTVAGTMDKPHKEKLVIASLYILAADGDMDERELMMLDDIRLGLKMSLRQLDKIKADFLSKRELNTV